jgi:hypothetical protein
MRKVQSRKIKINQLPISDELVMYSNFKSPKDFPNVQEVWDEEVADFYMGLFPDSLNFGANIADLQQRASLEAYTGFHNVSSFLRFLDGMVLEQEEDDEEE